MQVASKTIGCVLFVAMNDFAYSRHFLCEVSSFECILILKGTPNVDVNGYLILPAMKYGNALLDM